MKRSTLTLLIAALCAAGCSQEPVVPASTHNFVVGNGDLFEVKSKGNIERIIDVPPLDQLQLKGDGREYSVDDKGNLWRLGRLANEDDAIPWREIDASEKPKFQPGDVRKSFWFMAVKEGSFETVLKLTNSPYLEFERPSPVVMLPLLTPEQWSILTNAFPTNVHWFGAQTNRL